ncbi:hypothetical protein [Roseovarius aestuariivivens]|uniref:hypothetical protein n=1 Tax=Roseovarius aestuariivivens TaxID=1888910 RepID=UPI0010820BC4|nr:hypothetical protein [Roseovarius aestuariivivens]
MRRALVLAVVALAACKSDGVAQDAVSLPRPATELPEGRPDFAEWERTGKEVMPLDALDAKLEPIWQPVTSCQALGHSEVINEKSYRLSYLHLFSRSEGRTLDLGCAMEENGFYVSHVAHVTKNIWSDYNNREEPRLFTFFRVQSADGDADFVIYHVTTIDTQDRPRVGGCDHAAQSCYFLYDGPFDVVNLSNGLYERFPRVQRDYTDYPEEVAPVAMLLGQSSPEMTAFVTGDADGIPFRLAKRELVREVQRQYPEGAGMALDLTGYIRFSANGVVIEDVGANLGFAGTDASYVVRLQDTPVCEETQNEDVRQCTMRVETEVFAYNRATGSNQTKIAQIANVAASGRQRGEIEALFVRQDDGWRMIVTEETARFLSGIDRKNEWVVRTSDGRTLTGAPAASCIADPMNC